MDEGAPQDPPLFDITEFSEEARRALIERVLREHDESWASEALQLDQPFLPDEQQKLVELIQDPQKAFHTLTIGTEQGREFTEEEEEHLFTKIEEDPETVEIFYTIFVESGVIEEPSGTEARWIERLEKLRE